MFRSVLIAAGAAFCLSTPASAFIGGTFYTIPETVLPCIEGCDADTVVTFNGEVEIDDSVLPIDSTDILAASVSASFTKFDVPVPVEILRGIFTFGFKGDVLPGSGGLFVDPRTEFLLENGIFGVDLSGLDDGDIGISFGFSGFAEFALIKGSVNAEFTAGLIAAGGQVSNTNRYPGTAVPLPAPLALLGVSLAGLALVRRRRKPA